MNKLLLSLGVIGVITYCMPTFNAQAVCADTAPASYEEAEPRTAGLIRKCTLTATTSNGKLYLSGSTVCNSSMQYVGYKDIVIEYSSDNIHWYVENSNISDLLTSGWSYHLNNHELSVDGGYYYRVSCNHYAEGSNGSSQSVANTSNSVWIN